jgi:hypothetical protein
MIDVKEIRNYTGAPLVLKDKDGTTEFPVIGWVGANRPVEPLGSLCGVSFHSCPVATLVGLPQPEEGVVFVVPRELAEHPEILSRSDIACPHHFAHEAPISDGLLAGDGLSWLLKLPPQPDSPAANEDQMSKPEVAQ